MAAKVRAKAVSGSNIGNLRYDTYRNLINRINESHKLGFYLESITLCESIISDRLEHRLNHLAQASVIVNVADFSFSNLGDLIRWTKQYETQSLLFDLMPDLKIWKDSRNECLHEMAKIEMNSTKTWNDKILDAQKVSREGVSIMKKIKNSIDKINRIEKKQNQTL